MNSLKITGSPWVGSPLLSPFLCPFLGTGGCAGSPAVAPHSHSGMGRESSTQYGRQRLVLQPCLVSISILSWCPDHACIKASHHSESSAPSLTAAICRSDSCAFCDSSIVGTEHPTAFLEIIVSASFFLSFEHPTTEVRWKTNWKVMSAYGLKQVPASWRGTEGYRIGTDGKEEMGGLPLPLQAQSKGESALLLLLRCCGQSK